MYRRPRRPIPPIMRPPLGRRRWSYQSCGCGPLMLLPLALAILALVY